MHGTLKNKRYILVCVPTVRWSVGKLAPETLARGRVKYRLAIPAIPPATSGICRRWAQLLRLTYALIYLFAKKSEQN